MTVFLIQSAAIAFGLSAWVTYANVRRVTELGFSAAELGWVGAVLGAALFIFEIPTGLYADVFGRRRSIIQGVGLIGLGFGIEAFTRSFGGVLLAQVVWGLGWTLISGSRSAWLADEVGDERAAQAFMQAAQLRHGGAFAGIVVSGVLVSFSVTLPLHLGAATFLLLAVFLVLCMDETRFPLGIASPEPGDLQPRSIPVLMEKLRQGVRELRRHRAAATLVTAEIVLGAAGELFDRLWQLHLSEGIGIPPLGPLSPLSWFAVIEASTYLMVIPVLGWARGLVRVERLAFLLVLFQAGATISALFFALSGNFAVAVASWCSLQVMRRTINPLSTAWANHKLDPRVRATVLSVVNQATGLGGTLGGPLGGMVGATLGVTSALVTGAALTLPALGLFAWGARAQTRDAQGLTAKD